MAHPIIEHADQALAALGYTNTRVPPSAGLTSEQLFVRLPDDDQGRERQLMLTVYEGLGDNLEDADLLQCFLALPIVVAPEYRNDLSRLMTQINTRLPIGAFGFLDGTGIVFFRAMAMLPAQQETWTKLISEHVFMATFELDEFVPSVEAVATGEQTAREATAADPRLERIES